MNWCIEKTTSNERVIISNAMCSICEDMENVETLLDTVTEENFNCREQKPIDSASAARIGTMIRIAREIISDAIVSYHLTVADTRSVRAKNYIAAAEAVKTAMQCEEAAGRAYNELERKLPAEERNAFMEARVKIQSMEDAEAIKALNDLLKGKENYPIKEC